MHLDHQLNDLLSGIGKEFYTIRHQRDEKLTSVAKAIGVSHSVISQVENGRYHCLNLELVSRLANYYNVALELKLQNS
jgi:transcriptional regulator with XRE-family HTH domain